MCSIPDDHISPRDGTELDPERLRFEALAESAGLTATDCGRRFSTGREAFRIAGTEPGRLKYPTQRCSMSGFGPFRQSGLYPSAALRNSFARVL